jgi:hypothetical protein
LQNYAFLGFKLHFVGIAVGKNAEKSVEKIQKKAHLGHSGLALAFGKLSLIVKR